MATQDDLFTAAKNIVVALNNAAQTYLNVNGSTNAAGITTASIVKPSAGRVCAVSVIVGGSAVGKIYDGVNASATANPIYTIPTTVGAYVVNIPALYGIVVAPGTGQTISLSYS